MTRREVFEHSLSLAERVEATAQMTPEATAVAANGVQLSYRDLSIRSGLIAQALNDDITGCIAICMERSADLISSMMAVLKTNRPYTIVELGTASDAQIINRLSQIAPGQIIIGRDYESLATNISSAPNVVIIEDAIACAGCKTLRDCHPDPGQFNTQPEPEHTAYVVYTSGSSGTPKGVAVTHDNIAAYVTGISERLTIEGAVNCIHASSFEADLGNTSIFLALSSGGSLHILTDAERRDPQQFLDYLNKHDVDLLKITPSHWSALYDGRSLERRLKFLVFGGEQLNKSVAKTALGSAADTVVNHYGPSETTVGVCALPINSETFLNNIEGDVVPIGRLLSTCEGYLQNDHGTVAAVSNRGKLCIGGRQVADGYVNLSDTVESAFFDHPETDDRWYSTGDLVVADAQGYLTFLGRQDRQVKIRGYRVELDHVEAVAMSLPGIIRAGCIAKKTGSSSRLICAVQPDSADFSETALKSGLKARLEDHMVPGQIIVLDTLPVTSNGKTDYAALNDCLESMISDGEDRQTNQTDGESVVRIREIFAGILGHGHFSDNTSFFDAGGDSLGSIQLLCDLQAGGFEIGLDAFQNNASVSGVLANSTPTQQSAPTTSSVDQTIALSPSQKWFFSQNFNDQNNWNQAVLLDVAQDVDPNHLRAALQAVSRNHPLLRSRFSGDGSDIITCDPSVDITFSVSHHDTEDDLRDSIMSMSRDTNARIDITKGPIFAAHLMQSLHTQSKLYLVAHHLTVDLASWRCIVADLSRHYGELLKTGKTVDIPETENMLHWAAALEDHLTDVPQLAQADFTRNSANIEKQSMGIWYGLDPSSTTQFRAAMSRQCDGLWYGALLALFAKSIASITEASNLEIVTEGHGRREISGAGPLYRSVGWYTSIHQFSLDPKTDDLIDHTVKELRRAERSAHECSIIPSDIRPRPVSILFNFLGDTSLQNSGPLQVAPARELTAGLRGASNARQFDFKITGRLTGGQLIFDLSYDGETTSLSDARAIITAFHKEITETLPIGTTPISKVLDSHPPSNGALFYVPQDLLTSRTRECETVLITGATGYLGAHFLRHLLLETDHDILCLVRDKPGQSAEHSLSDAYSWYFARSELEANQDRLTVIRGDIQSPRLGLSQDLYDDLTSRVHKVAHFAAEINLIGDNSNAEATEEIIQFCRASVMKELHYMSTLAVSGTVDGKETVDFSERSLNIGQVFLNAYERSKFECEFKVQDYFSHGGTGKIYRAGNVSGCSTDGRFQKNAIGNRFVGLLSAICDLGMVPDMTGETICLTPIDDVAHALFLLFQSPDHDRETFHVDNGAELDMRLFYEALDLHAGPLLFHSSADLKVLFDQFATHDSAQQMLGKLWAGRADRNVRFDHSSTTDKLRDLGFEYSLLDRVWVEKFILGLKRRNVLQKTSGQTTN